MKWEVHRTRLLHSMPTRPLQPYALPCFVATKTFSSRQPKQHTEPAHPCPGGSQSPRRPPARGGTAPACLHRQDGGGQQRQQRRRLWARPSSIDSRWRQQKAAVPSITLTTHCAAAVSRQPSSVSYTTVHQLCAPDTSSAMVMASGSSSCTSSLASMR